MMMGLISDGKVNRQSHDGEYSVSEESGRPLNRCTIVPSLCTMLFVDSDIKSKDTNSGLKFFASSASVFALKNDILQPGPDWTGRAGSAGTLGAQPCRRPYRH